MLVQRSEMRVPGTDAICRQAAMRGRGFALSWVWSMGLATDWGVQSHLVKYIRRQTRCQLSIVLAGRGYVRCPTGVSLLREGDVVELDQRFHDDEGYGGSPSEVLVVEWDGDGRLGPERRGPPRCSRIGLADTARLRGLVARLSHTEPGAWFAELVTVLRGLGLPAPRVRALDALVPLQAQQLYRAFGSTRAQLERYPSLSELSEELGMSERHLRRGFELLETEFGMTTAGWREYLNDTRMSWAQQLLSVPEVPMSRVATMSGFRSPVAFAHAFKSRSGMTPGDVARTLREHWR
jgi:AraC-like DNA-binding protein